MKYQKQIISNLACWNFLDFLRNFQRIPVGKAAEFATWIQFENSKMQKGYFLHDYTCLAIVAIYCIKTWLDLLCMYTGWINCDIIFSLKFFHTRSFEWKYAKPSGKLISLPNFVYSVSNFNLLIFKLHKVWVRLDKLEFSRSLGKYSFQLLMYKQLKKDFSNGPNVLYQTPCSPQK